MPMPFCCRECSCCKLTCSTVNEPDEFEVMPSGLSPFAGSLCADCSVLNGATYLVPKTSPCTYALTYPAVAPCLWGLSVLFLPDNYLSGGELTGYFLQVVMSNQFDDFFSTVVFQKHYDDLIDCMNLDDDIPFDHYVNGAYGQLCTAEGSSCRVRTHV